MAVSGTVKEVIKQPGKLKLDTVENEREATIYVERNKDSECIAAGDYVWWTSKNAYWTPKNEDLEDIKIKRII